MPDFDVKEKRFEQDIEEYLLTHGGYQKLSLIHISIAIERRIQTISSARLTVPPEIRAIPTGKTKAIEDGRIAWLMLINGQQCLYPVSYTHLA